MDHRPMYVATKAIIFDGDKLLLVKKTEGNFWDLPGGRINFGEHPIVALKRELSEELPGFRDFSIKQLLGLRKKEGPISDGNELMLIYFLVESTSPQNTLELSDEHSDQKFFTYDEVQKLDQPLNLVYGEIMEKVLTQKENPLSEESVVIY